MRTISKTLLIGALIAACGDSDAPAPPQAVGAQPAPEQVIEPGDSGSALPPGLAPVAVDPPGVDAAGPSAGPDRPVSSPAQPSRPAPQPAAPSGETDAPAIQDDGAAILRRAASAYEQVRSMRASFVMQFDNPLLRQKTTSRGTIYQQQPDRIALRFTDPAGDVILSDGQHFYVYQPSVDAKQATRSPAAAGAGGGVDLQAQFIGNPVERFQFTLHGTETVAGRPAHAMTLVPRERAGYRSLKVWFDARDSLARRFEITEHNGSVRRFDLSELQVNPTIPAEVFRFTPPADVRVVNVG